MGLIIGLLIFSSTGFAKVDEWTKKADMPTARDGLSASEVSGKIYVIGGMTCGNGPCAVLQTVEEYDPALDKWVEKADMPTGRSDLGTVVVNGKIYAIGGMTDGTLFSSVVEEYDQGEDGWKKKSNMIIGRFNLATAVVKGRIYAIGGSTTLRKGNNNDLIFVSTAAVEEYDPVSDTWTQKADMPTPRFGLAAAVVKNKIYCIGGMNEDNNPDILSTVEEYDPALDKWTEKADMPTPRYTLSASAVNNKIYCMGGSNRDDNLAVTDLAVTEEYDPIADKWKTKAEMIVGRFNPSTSAVNGKIYVIGGYNKMDLSTVEEYDTGFTSISVDAKGKLAASWGEIKKYSYTRED